MGFLDKLKFWKRHEDEFEMPESLPGEKPGSDLGMPELGPMPKEPQMPQMEEPEVAPAPHMRDYQPAPMPTGTPTSAQLEIISSKLDAIKAILSALEQRIANLERSSRYEKRW